MEEAAMTPQVSPIPTPSLSSQDSDTKTAGFGEEPQTPTLIIHGDFPEAGYTRDRSDEEWIATTPPNTQSAVRITHVLKLLVEVDNGDDQKSDTWELSGNVVLVDVSRRLCDEEV
jgi:hypothetical protein